MDKISANNKLNNISYGGSANSRLSFTRRQFLAATAAFALSGYRLKSVLEATDVVVIEGVGRAGNIPLADQMTHSLDRALSRLTGQEQLDTAWSSLFSPGDRISVKIDARSPLAYTNPALIGTLLERFFTIGIQPWDISVWDKRISDVNKMANGIATRRGRQQITATEAANQGDADIAGYREEGGYQPAWLEGADSRTFSLVSRHLSDADMKIVNLPTPKHHSLIGIDGALVSLAFGGFNNVNRFRSSPETMARAVVEIWRTKALSSHVLTIMDATRLIFHGGPVGLPSWRAEPGALIMGFDPVAVDSVALDMIEAGRKAAQLPLLGEAGRILLKEAEKNGVGTAEPGVVRLSAAL